MVFIVKKLYLSIYTQDFLPLQKNKNDELSRIAGELSIQGNPAEEEDDLLNLMDSA